MKVTSFESIREGMDVKLVASYIGYSDGATQIDYFVGENGIVVTKDYESVKIKFPDRADVSANWWYPPYCLEFPGDEKSLTIDNVKEGRVYTIRHRLETFREFRYKESIDTFTNIDIEIGGLNENYIAAKFCQLDEKVKVLHIIPVRPIYNDVIVWCEHTVSKKNTLLPLTCLYSETPIPLYMRSAEERRNRFVYEFKDWKNNIS